VADLVERFEAEHERLYGTRLEPGSPVDIRALRLIALGPERPPLALASSSSVSQGQRPASRPADFGRGPADVPVRSRASLGADPVEGPLLLDEYDTTVVVPPGWTVRFDERTGALVLDHVAAALEAAAHDSAIARQIL